MTDFPEAALRDLESQLLAMPPARALQPRVAGYSDGRLRLYAPLAANVNDKGSAFGGSLSSLMTLAAWGLTSLAVGVMMTELLLMIPATASPGAWYVGSPMLVLAVPVALATWAFFTTIRVPRARP